LLREQEFGRAWIFIRGWQTRAGSRNINLDGDVNIRERILKYGLGGAELQR